MTEKLIKTLFYIVLYKKKKAFSNSKSILIKKFLELNLYVQRLSYLFKVCPFYSHSRKTYRQASCGLGVRRINTVSLCEL